MPEAFFSFGLAPDPLLWAQHDPWLVLLSLVVSMGASAVALHMAALARELQHAGRRRLALFSGSLALGSGVWTMHYIGMLAFAVCGQGSFDPLLTVLSVIPSLGASWVALHQLMREQISLRTLLGSGVLVGAGIGTMHYVGMAASSVAPSMRYDLPIFLLSILIAVLLAMLALWVRFGLARALQRRRNLLTALAGMVMGGAIAGMHYTGMAALRFVEPIDQLLVAGSGGTVNAPLSVAIAIVTMVLSLLVLAVNDGMRYRQLFRQIQRNERLQRAILDTAADAVVMFDGEGTVRSFNSGAQRIFGWQPAEVIGRNFSMLLPPEDRQHRPATFMRGMRTPQRRAQGGDVDLRGLHHDGRTFPARLSLGRVESGDEQLFVGFISDLSLNQAMELALRRSEQQLRSLLDNLPGIAYRRQLALPGLMEFVSDGVAELSGYGAEDFLCGRVQWQVLVHPEELAGAAAAIRRQVELGQAYQLEYRIVAANGEVRWVADRGRGVRDEEIGQRWVDGMMFDISARRAMEEALREAKARAEQAAEARANFLANMSHEIRTPMNAVIGFSEALLDSPLEDGQRRQLTAVLQSGRSLLGLLNDILDAARLDKGAVMLEEQDFSLRALCVRVIDAQAGHAARKQLLLELDYPPAIAEYYRGDAQRIEQVLLSLTDNAIKFTASGRVGVRVAASAEAGVLICIEDSGIGMSAEQIEHIFDPFAQGDASSTRRFGGTGLGTTIARQLVELMGGQIEVSSTPGVGSVFTVHLPLRAGEAAGRSAPLAGAAVAEVAETGPLEEASRACALAAIRRAAGCLRQGELPEAALAELAALLGNERLLPLIDAVESFDFERALAHLQVLAGELGAAEGE
ncbi:MAG: MHYT domain-containing protein [Thauera sp.]|jgi:PAS domain S-box-containing protein|nr:MHYT domain-containing protein [Thauera sp.]